MLHPTVTNLACLDYKVAFKSMLEAGWFFNHPFTTPRTGTTRVIRVKCRMKLGTLLSLLTLGQALQGLTSWFTFVTHLNTVQFETCDLYSKNEFCRPINIAHG